MLYIGGSEAFAENFTMLFLMVAAIILTTFSRNLAALVLSGSQLVGYMAYKLFRAYAGGVQIAPASFLWLVLPLADPRKMMAVIDRMKELGIPYAISVMPFSIP